MTVRYRGSEQDSNFVKEYLQDVIREKMTATPNELLVKDVTDLSFVGDFDSLSPPSSKPSAATQTRTVESSDSARLGSIISASVVLLGGLLLLFRRRHRQAAEVTESSIENKATEEIHDLETGSTYTCDTGLQISTSLETLENANSYDTQESAPTLLVDTAEDDQTYADVLPPTPPMSPTQPMPPTPPLPPTPPVDPTEALLALLAAASFAPALPPRPPRRGSMKLKKKRRRKKKKKKAVLKRVNSRENVNQMEAIAESEDEGSEFCSEGDSEYSSTDDDGSSNHSSSGCLTPIGTHSHPGSRTSSRASSPRLSPQDELFPSDVFSSDFDFVIEAPDFPFDLDGKHVKPQQQQKQPKEDRLQPRKRPTAKVSPIKEKKMLRIPPPWI
jgi:hypothetical protein